MDVTRTSKVPRSVSARAASPEDVGRIAELHLEAAEWLAGRRGGAQLVAERHRGTTAATVADSVAADVDQELRLVLVGCIGSAVVGHGVLHLPVPTRETEQSSSAEILELFVEPAAREVGVGTAILALMASRASEHGCGGLDATVLPGDRATKNFFEDHAMAARALVVHGSLTS